MQLLKLVTSSASVPSHVQVGNFLFAAAFFCLDRVSEQDQQEGIKQTNRTFAIVASVVACLTLTALIPDTVNSQYRDILAGSLPLLGWSLLVGWLAGLAHSKLCIFKSPCALAIKSGAVNIVQVFIFNIFYCWLFNFDIHTWLSASVTSSLFYTFTAVTQPVVLKLWRRYATH